MLGIQSGYRLGLGLGSGIVLGPGLKFGIRLELEIHCGAIVAEAYVIRSTRHMLVGTQSWFYFTNYPKLNII